LTEKQKRARVKLIRHPRFLTVLTGKEKEMVFLLRIETNTGKSITRNSDLQEMLGVLADAEMKVTELSADQDETLRGWLLLKAEAMKPGENIANHNGTNAGVGKTAEGRAFVKDHRGEWPPPRPGGGGDDLHGSA
jgi:hypothetical protein